MSELAKQYDVDAGQIGTWKCAAIKNMAVGFLKRGFNREQSNEAAVDKLHSRTGQDQHGRQRTLDRQAYD